MESAFRECLANRDFERAIAVLLVGAPGAGCGALVRGAFGGESVGRVEIAGRDVLAGLTVVDVAMVVEDASAGFPILRSPSAKSVLFAFVFDATDKRSLAAANAALALVKMHEDINVMCALVGTNCTAVGAAAGGRELARLYDCPYYELGSGGVEAWCREMIEHAYRGMHSERWFGSAKARFLRERDHSVRFESYLMDTDNIEQIRPLQKDGHVWLCRDKATAEEIAAKYINSEVDDRGFRMECEVLGQARHPCLMSLYGVGLGTGSQPFIIATRYMKGGSLEDVMKTKPDWFTSTVKTVMVVGIALGMQYLHSKEIIHRDLKPANVMIDEFHLPHIGDFGTIAENDDSTKTKGVGTWRYMAPEQTGDHYTEKVDVYSFGLIVYELVTGEHAFADCSSYLAVAEKILTGKLPHVPSSVPSFVKSIVERCWNREPEERPAFDEIVDLLVGNEYQLFPDVNTLFVSLYYEWVTQFFNHK